MSSCTGSTHTHTFTHPLKPRTNAPPTRQRCEGSHVLLHRLQRGQQRDADALEALQHANIHQVFDGQRALGGAHLGHALGQHQVGGLCVRVGVGGVRGVRGGGVRREHLGHALRQHLVGGGLSRGSGE